APTNPPPSPAPTNPPPSPAPTSPPPPKPTPGGTRGPKPGLERGGLWSGQIHVHFRQALDSGTSKTVSDIKTDVAAHLREYRRPLLRTDTRKQYGTLVNLEPEGTEVRSKAVMDTQGTLGGSHCEGQGAFSLTVQPDAPEYGHGSTIWISNVDADTTPWIGVPIVRGSPRYAVGVHGLASDKFTANCKAWSADARVPAAAPWAEEEPYFMPGVGHPFHGCPTSVIHMCDPEIRTIQGESGRMHGSYHNVWDEDGFHCDLEVRWSLCRDDVPCKDQPPKPERTPCQGTAVQDGLLGQCLDAERAIERAMKPHWDEYEKESHEASRHLADYKLAKRLCTAWDMTMKILDKLLESEMFLEGLPAADAEEVKEFKEALGQLKGVIDNLYEGKSAVVPFEPDQIQKIGEYTEKINKLLETLHLFLNGSPEQLAEKLRDCGAPLPDDLYESAQQYLLHLQASLEALREVDKLVNDLRSKENDCLTLQFDAYKACIENARCKGTDESACDSLKPPGNWPGV
ncbi:MAG: hypothetical protein ACHQQS_08910, partial [Thermoanaerobaculales bacterium]